MSDNIAQGSVEWNQQGNGAAGGGRQGGRGGRMMQGRGRQGGGRGRGGRGRQQMQQPGRIVYRAANGGGRQERGQQQQGGGSQQQQGGGRGGGRGGQRNQQQQNQQQMMPGFLDRSYFKFLHPTLWGRIFTFLERNDKIILGTAYPRWGQLFAQQEQQRKQREAMMKQRQEQLKQQQKQQQQRQAAQQKLTGGQTKDATQKEEKVTELEKATEELNVSDEKQNKEEEDGEAGDGEKKEEPTSDEPKKEQDDETKDEEKKEDDSDDKKTTTPIRNVDPHTLLARLNTRRLAQRIQYLKKSNQKDQKSWYPLHKTTAEIAMTEWKQQLSDFKEKNQKLKELKDIPEEEKGETKQQEDDRLPLLPSPYELLLFSPCPRAVAVLASYPRSGNSLLRNLYEKTTLRVSGSDMRGGLEKHDLVGEAAVQTNMVQFVKTHWPERRGTPPFLANRAVLLVRNPYDAIESYYNLMMTNTHDTAMNEEQLAKHKQDFELMALKEVIVWKQFHDYWLSQNIPLLVIRYEDLIRRTDYCMTKILKFVLEIDDISFFQERINNSIAEQQIEALGPYKPKNLRVGKSLKKYSTDCLTKMNAGLYAAMKTFGYDEMLVPKPESWKLEPLDDYGVLIHPKDRKDIVVNNPKEQVCRTPQLQTNWMVMRRRVQGLPTGPCNCAACKAKQRFN